MDARRLFLSSIQEYIHHNKEDVIKNHSRCKLFVDRVRESGRDCNWLQTYEKEEEDLRDDLQWMEFLLSIKEPIEEKVISKCLYPESVRYIEEKISSFRETHRGTKDDLKIFMIMNAPHNVKLTLIDHLFLSSSVCKLHVNLLSLKPNELENKLITLASIYHHWVMNLVVIDHNLSENLVVMDPVDTISFISLFHHADDPTQLFHQMIPKNTNVLLCLSNIDIITQGCSWAKDSYELKSFWMTLYSFTRACSPWIHIIATSNSSEFKDFSTSNSSEFKDFSTSNSSEFKDFSTSNSSEFKDFSTSQTKNDHHQYGITLYASDMTYHHVNLLHNKK
jgi:hypothetical protein